jgi:hypothetical protein
VCHVIPSVSPWNITELPLRHYLMLVDFALDPTGRNNKKGG